MPHAYTEDQLVEQPAIGLFAGLGCQVAVSEQGFRGIRSLLALIAGREPDGGEEQIHNLPWIGHTPEKLPCVNWKS